MAAFLCLTTHKTILSKDIYKQLKENNVKFQVLYCRGTEESETCITSPTSPDMMFFSKFDTIDEIYQNLLNIFNEYEYSHKGFLLDSGKIINTRYVILSFDQEDTEDIFYGGSIQLTCYISPKGDFWYDVGVIVSRNLNIE